MTARKEFEPVIAGIAAVKVAYDLYPDQFLWKEPPYEYVYDRNPFDVIAGTGGLRESLERGESLEKIADSWKERLAVFTAERAKYLLY